MKLAETGTGSAYHDPGLFDECLSATALQDNDEIIRPHSFTSASKYCTVFFDLQQPRLSLWPSPIGRISSNNRSTDNDESAKLAKRNSKRHSNTENNNKPVNNMSNFVKSSVAFCIPSSCTVDDLLLAVANHLSRHRRLSSLIPISSEDFCYTTNKIREDSRFDIGAIVTCCFIGFLGLVTITATIHEAIIKRSAPPKDSFLYCFSVIRNGRELLSINKTVGVVDELSCLYGIRFISMCILIAFHVGSAALSGNTFNTTQCYQVTMMHYKGFIIPDNIFLIHLIYRNPLCCIIN